jgi:osmotically inducible lipoprotein OsmB
MKKICLSAALSGLALMLGACGTDSGDRVASGAGIGAATGAGIGFLFGGVGAIPGALIGAAVGGGTAATTDPEDVNLGKPLWDRQP